MSKTPSFTPRPQAARRHASSFDAENSLQDLDIITLRIERIADTRVEAFNANNSDHDSTCMAIIRLAALLEREEYAFYIDTRCSSEKHTLQTHHKIAAHSGH